MLNPFRRRPYERTGFELYTRAVGAARHLRFYTDLAVPDTLDGRFDVIALHVVLVMDRLRRLPAPGPDIAQAVFDAMFADMDHVLREIGVSDMAVGKRVRAMWEALHGRANAYLPVMADNAALTAALVRNVWRGEPAGQGAQGLSHYAAALHTGLNTQGLETLGKGLVAFPAEREAVTA